jgi:hypothetical protein
VFAFEYAGLVFGRIVILVVIWVEAREGREKEDGRYDQ